MAPADTHAFSYNAHTTATDVLWGGVPVVRSRLRVPAPCVT